MAQNQVKSSRIPKDIGGDDMASFLEETSDARSRAALGTVLRELLRSHQDE